MPGVTRQYLLTCTYHLGRTVVGYYWPGKSNSLHRRAVTNIDDTMIEVNNNPDNMANGSYVDEDLLIVALTNEAKISEGLS